MNSIRTKHSRVNLLDPDPESLMIEDVIYATHNIRRFTGHSEITLAQHLARACLVCEQHLRVTDTRVLRAALMHDAHEILIADVSTPMKKQMRNGHQVSEFDEIEMNLMQAYAERFDFPYPLPEEVHEADRLCLSIEADMTWGEGEAERWGLPAPIERRRFWDIFENEFFLQAYRLGLCDARGQQTRQDG